MVGGISIDFSIIVLATFAPLSAVLLKSLYRSDFSSLEAVALDASVINETKIALPNRVQK